MPKCLKCLNIRIANLVFISLWLLAIIYFFTFYGQYNYAHIDQQSIQNKLYKVVNPNILRKGKPDCNYDSKLQSTKTINAWEVRKSYNDFDAHGIANGTYVPENCNPLFSVAILVTYRNRQKQLDIFLPYMHNFLRKQNIHYRIYLIEQTDEKAWNKGILYNIGAKQAIADKFPCLVLQDVDLLPLDYGNLYTCMTQPRHFSASIDKFRFVLPYDWLVGGVMAIRTDQYIELNGFSNRFFGWGGEDDDFSSRITEHGLEIVRFPPTMSRYTMLQHRQEPKNEDRLRIMADRDRGDGLKAVVPRTSQVIPHRLFTLIAVKL